MKYALNFLILALLGSTVVMVIMGTTTKAVSPSEFGLTEGDTISASTSNDPDVYIVNINGFKRLIVNPTIFQFYGHLSFNNVKIVSAQTRDSFETANLYRNCETNDQRVYALEVLSEDNSLLHWVNMSGPQAAAEDPDFFKQVFCINSREFNFYSKGADYTSTSQIPTYSRFGVGGGPTPTPTITPTPTPSPSPMPTPTPVTGGVSFALAADNPAGTTLPKGSTGAMLLKFTASNTNNVPVTVTNVTVKRSGPGAATDFSDLYLFQGSNRLTFGQSINSSTNEANFSGVNFVIPANGSTTLSVLGDVSATASTGSVHSFSILRLIASGFTATGSAAGNNMTIGGVSAGTITIAKSGVLSNPQLNAQDAEVAQFQLTSGSSEDLKVQRITLTNAGNVSSSDLRNLELKDKATNATLATAFEFDSKNRATFEIASSIMLDRGTTKTFSVIADIGSSARAGDTSRIYLESPVDLLAIGQTLGFGATVNRNDYDNSANDGSDASWVIIAPGQITFIFTGPAAKDIAKNGKDIDIFNFTVTPQVNAEIRKIRFTFDGGSGTADFIGAGNVANYTDIKISDVSNGAVIWGPQDFSGTDGGAGDTAQTLTFSGTTNLIAGQPRSFKLTHDVANNASVTSGDSIRAILDMSGFSNEIRNTDNNSFISTSDIVPSTSIVGNTMTVRIPSLNLTLATIPTSQTFVKGSNDAPFVGFNFSAGTASDVRISSLRVTCYIDASNTDTNDFVKGQDVDTSGTVSCLETVPTIRLKVDGVQVGDNKSPASGTDGTATFSNLNLNIPAGSTKVIQVYGDISSSAFRNGNVERIAFDIDSASGDVSASDISGNAITTAGDDPNGATSPLRIVTVQNLGTLAVSAAPTEIDVTDSRIIPAGGSDITMSKIRFTAQNEELKLTKARILVDSLDADADVSDNIVSVSLYDGATKIAGPTALTPVSTVGTVDAFADFNVISPDFVIPKDSDKILTVKASLNTISGGADSGDEFRSALDFDDNFEARGTTSSTVITTAGTSNTNGNYVVLRKGQPRVNLSALPTTTLSNGNQVLMRFAVQAQNNDVSLKHITFETQSSDATVTLANAAIREMGTSTDIPSTASVTTVGNTSTIKVTFTSEQQVTSGGTRTFDLRVDVSGAGSGDTLSTRALGDSAIVTGELGPLVSAQQLDDLDDVFDIGNDTDNDAEYNFIWADLSAIPHNDTASTVDDTDEAGSNDWTNGRYIRLVPSDTQTLNFPS